MKPSLLAKLILAIIALMFILCLTSCKKEEMQFWVRHSHTAYILKTARGFWDTTYYYGNSTTDLQPWPEKKMSPSKADKFCRENLRVITTRDYDWAWQTGKVGWMGLSHIGGDRRYPDQPNMETDVRKDLLAGKRLFLCEITVKPLLSKNGKPITKIVRKRA